MTTDEPQLYLTTPPEVDRAFSDRLASLLDAHDIACIRLGLATRDEEVLLRTADALRAVSEPRDVAMVVTDHWKIAERAGLDGVHLSDGARQVKRARADLGQDKIVGAYCGASRHDGMLAGEVGADYVSFGPVGGPDLGRARAPLELFAWWSDTIEVPVVAEGGLGTAEVIGLRSVADFLVFGEEIWRADAPEKRLSELLAAE